MMAPKADDEEGRIAPGLLLQPNRQHGVDSGGWGGRHILDLPKEDQVQLRLLWVHAAATGKRSGTLHIIANPGGDATNS
jgi:hypothetical protein